MQPHQRSLLVSGAPGVRPEVPVTRRDLGSGAWAEVHHGWLDGADDVLDALIDAVPWRQGRRRMYDRTLDDPRLSCWYRSGDALPHPVLDEARHTLEARCAVPLPTLGCNLYRDGADSVAWHRDRELRELDDTLIAIITLGAQRSFLLRPIGGGRSIDLRPASGDLLVMGGTCQLMWEHCVPKCSQAGPRISATFRWAPSARRVASTQPRTPANRSSSKPPSVAGTSTSERWSV